MMSDLRYAVRMLAKSPGFVAVALLSLGLAIGANSAVFAILNALFLQPVIPLRPEQVVNVYTARQAADRSYRPFSHQEFSRLRESADVFSDVAAFRPATVGIGNGDRTRRSFAFVVSDNYFDLLGAKPAKGRFFSPAEARPDAGIPVAVASYAMWMRSDASPNFVGQTVHINGQPCTVVGVAPKGFSGGNALLAPDVWLPLGLSSRLSAGFNEKRASRDLGDPKTTALHVVARLRPDLTSETAQPRLPLLAQRIAEVTPDPSEGPRMLQIERPSRFNIDTEPASDGPLLLFGILLLCMSALVLLVACLNLANMSLARSAIRAHEMAVRAALGASRWRAVRLLVLEGSVVALIGGAAGLLVGWQANSLLLDSLSASSLFATTGISLALEVVPDARVDRKSVV
jgi:predicted permease